MDSLEERTRSPVIQKSLELGMGLVMVGVRGVGAVSLGTAHYLYDLAEARGDVSLPGSHPSWVRCVKESYGYFRE